MTPGQDTDPGSSTFSTQRIYSENTPKTLNKEVIIKGINTRNTLGDQMSSFQLKKFMPSNVFYSCVSSDEELESRGISLLGPLLSMCHFSTQR